MIRCPFFTAKYRACFRNHAECRDLIRSRCVTLCGVNRSEKLTKIVYCVCLKRDVGPVNIALNQIKECILNLEYENIQADNIAKRSAKIRPFTNFFSLRILTPPASVWLYLLYLLLTLYVKLLPTYFSTHFACSLFSLQFHDRQLSFVNLSTQSSQPPMQGLVPK